MNLQERLLENENCKWTPLIDKNGIPLRLGDKVKFKYYESTIQGTLDFDDWDKKFIVRMTQNGFTGGMAIGKAQLEYVGEIND